MNLKINTSAIIERSMNKIDERLMEHGKRVGYMIYWTLKAHGWSGARLRDMALLGILHDVGAYKTEELDNMVQFETTDVWAHSIYGYLFMKHFSPMKKLAPVLLYHHARAGQVGALDAESAMLAQLTFLCDRADLFYLTGGDFDGFVKYLAGVRDRLFSGEAIDMLVKAGVTHEVWAQVNEDADFAQLLRDEPMSEADTIGFLKMVVFSIDFRSPQTLLHTHALTLVARKLAELVGVPEQEIRRIEVGALVHDIGKMGTPLHILESTGKLSDADFAIMRQHVSVSEEILTGCIDDDIVAMAANHHEKMDGTGYPNQLKGAALPVANRIISVADVLSALWGNRSYKPALPKEKVLEILADMRGGHLDEWLVDLAVAYYDEIAAVMTEHAKEIEDTYAAVGREQAEIGALLKTGEYDLSAYFQDCYA